MKTYAPSATNRFAVARPIPLLPPVTTATLPSSFPLIVITPYLVLSNVVHRSTVVHVIELAFDGGRRPSASSPRSVIQVLDARATSRRCSSKMLHSTRPTILPARTIAASARSFAFHTGRKKLIFSSRVVKLSPFVSVLR